jgi:CO/xanthine dehydrogenase FAD-binding subunit
MKRPEPFEIFQPTSVLEASRIQKENGPGGYFLAGGTDLVIAIKEKGFRPRYLIDLKRIDSLSGIREDSSGTIRIGALTTAREVETSSAIRRRYPFLAQSAAEIGSIQIRNRATIGGNMANATPSADTAPALLVLKTVAKVAGPDGEREVALEDFFVGPGKTVLQPGEILTELVIPPAAGTVRGEYIKFSPRETMDLAYVGVAVALILEGTERRCIEARIALGAVAPVPLRAHQAEAALSGQIITKEIAERAGAIAATECQPISDVRSSAQYRREMVRVNTTRAIRNALLDRPEELAWEARRERRY